MEKKSVNRLLSRDSGALRYQITIAGLVCCLIVQAITTMIQADLMVAYREKFNQGCSILGADTLPLIRGIKQGNRGPRHNRYFNKTNGILELLLDEHTQSNRKPEVLKV